MSDINITNNFNAPIGQHIDHVDTINLQMDGDGQFHFGMVEKTSYQNKNQNENDVELFHFIHPAMDEEEGIKIHNEVKRLVKRQKVQMICQHLLQMKDDKKLLLPPNPSVVYEELVRLGMSNNEGFNENTFRKYYSNR